MPLRFLKLLVIVLGMPGPVYAHGIHPIWVVGALSPLAVLLLIAGIGWLARSLKLAAVHAALVTVWVALFWLASYFVTNDYLIWAPLAAYLIHSVVIIGLVPWYALKRARSRKGVA
jgi:hypothetical protein